MFQTGHTLLIGQFSSRSIVLYVGMVSIQIMQCSVPKTYGFTWFVIISHLNRPHADHTGFETLILSVQHLFVGLPRSRLIVCSVSFWVGHTCWLEYGATYGKRFEMATIRWYRGCDLDQKAVAIIQGQQVIQPNGKHTWLVIGERVLILRNRS